MQFGHRRRVVPLLILGLASAAHAQPAPVDAPTPTLPTPTPINQPPASPPPAPADAAAPSPNPAVPPSHLDEGTNDQPSNEQEPAYEGPDSEDTSRPKGKGTDHGEVYDKPGKGLYVLAAKNKAKVRLNLTVQPMMRFVHDNKVTDDNVIGYIRRARLGFKATLRDGFAFKWEIQIKNMHFGLGNLYGEYQFSDRLRIKAGFLKTPGGLERDSYAFDEPFNERSSLSDLTTYDREVGVKLEGAARGMFWAASLSRNAPPGSDGGDPEDAPKYPPGFEADDVTNAASKWNTAGRIGTAPSHDFEASVYAGARFRPDEPDFGDRGAEPFDSGYLDARPYRGTNVHVGADAALSQPHFRVMTEAAYRRDGRQLDIDFNTGTVTPLNGHEWWTSGYVVFGFTPNGKYGAAVHNAPLKKGWEIITRLEGTRIKPVDQAAATFLAVTTGFHWEATKQFRFQVDAALMKFGNHDITSSMTNVGATRVMVETWATWRL